MSKKYLSLEEAAESLGVSSDDLKRLREKGEIRGFADRATWKFRQEDIDEYRRRMNPDSAPEVPIMADDDSSILIGEEPVSDDSASDVRLILDDELTDDSEPEVPVMVSDESVSDVQMISDEGQGSDSDVKLVGDGSGSDSDVRIVPDESASHILADDSLTDEEGLTLAAGSSILGGEADSGISLEAADSGISLEAADSGISLESLDSGINLTHHDSAEFNLDDDDSGISLSDEDHPQATQAMDALGSDEDLDDTRFELETAGSSEYEISGLGEEEDDSDDTSVLLLDDEDESDAGSRTVVGAGDIEEETFDLGEDAVDEFGEDDLEVAPDVLGEDDELDELDVFDAVDEDFETDFEEAGSAGEFAAPVAMGVRAPVEVEWGAGTFAGVAIASVLMALCGVIMIDLVRSMWSFEQPAHFSGPILEMIAGFFS